MKIYTENGIPFTFNDGQYISFYYSGQTANSFGTVIIGNDETTVRQWIRNDFENEDGAGGICLIRDVAEFTEVAKAYAARLAEWKANDSEGYGRGYPPPF